MQDAILDELIVQLNLYFRLESTYLSQHFCAQCVPVWF